MVQLPKELEDDFHRAIHQFEEEKRMPYVTSIERAGIEKGMKKGLQLGILESICDNLEQKFGAAGKKLLPKIKALEDLKRLRKLRRAITAAESVEELKELLD